MAVLVEAYNRCKRSAAAQVSLQTTREHNAWIRSERRLLHVLPPVAQQEILGADSKRQKKKNSRVLNLNSSKSYASSNRSASMISSSSSTAKPRTYSEMSSNNNASITSDNSNSDKATNSFATASRDRGESTATTMTLTSEMSSYSNFDNHNDDNDDDEMTNWVVLEEEDYFIEETTADQEEQEQYSMKYSPTTFDQFDDSNTDFSFQDNQNMSCYKSFKKMVGKCTIHTRHYLVRFAEDWRVKGFFSSITFWCILILLATTDDPPEFLKIFLNFNEIALVGIFWFEVLLLISGYGFKVYIRNAWNRVDLLSSLIAVGMLVCRLTIANFSTHYRTVAWFLRVARVVKLAKGTAFRTIFVRFGNTLRRLSGVLALMVFFFFAFSVVANRLFGRVVWGPVGTNAPNHQNAFRGAFLGCFYLLRLALGGSWPDVWWNLRNKAPGCELEIGDCGPPTPLPELFFFVFIVTFTFILKNLLVAVAVDVFASSGDYRSLLKVDAQTTTKLWMITQAGRSVTNPIQLKMLYTERVVLNSKILRFIRSLPSGFPTCPIWQWEKEVSFLKKKQYDESNSGESGVIKDDDESLAFKKRGLLEPALILRVLEILFVMHQIRWRKTEAKRLKKERKYSVLTRNNSRNQSMKGSITTPNASFPVNVISNSFGDDSSAPNALRKRGQSRVTFANEVKKDHDDDEDEKQETDHEETETKQQQQEPPSPTPSKPTVQEEQRKEKENLNDDDQQQQTNSNNSDDSTSENASFPRQTSSVSKASEDEENSEDKKAKSPECQQRENESPPKPQQLSVEDDPLQYEKSKPVTCTFSEVCDVLLHMAFMAPFSPESRDRVFNTMNLDNIRMNATENDWEKATEFAFDLWLAEEVANVWIGKCLARKIRKVNQNQEEAENEVKKETIVEPKLGAKKISNENENNEKEIEVKAEKTNSNKDSPTQRKAIDHDDI